MIKNKIICNEIKVVEVKDRHKYIIKDLENTTIGGF